MIGFCGELFYRMRKKRRFTATRMIMVGFFLGIAIGTFLLMLPICSESGEGTNFFDALFMATSSICVTGLATVAPVVQFNVLGQVVMMLLIQFGGLGVVTFSTVILLAIGKRITLTDRMMIQEAYNLDTLSGLVRLTKRIVKGTLIVEGIGAILYAVVFVPEYGLLQGAWMSVFTSVSAFCNAGFDLVGANSLVDYVGNPVINITTMALIVIGGLGFPVWWELIRVFRLTKKYHFRHAFWGELNLHTKLVLIMTGLLIVLGALLVLVMEYDNPATLGELPFGTKVMASLFQSVTLRTAGFATIAQSEFRHVTCMVFIVLMFIGGSPSGTAGGVKTVTFAILVLSTISIIRGKHETEVMGRHISDVYTRKALAVVSFSFSVLFLLTMALMYVQQGDFLDTVYEMTSAIATVGLSRGMTGALHELGKCIVSLTMYLGRVGPISLALALNVRARKKGTSFSDAKIIVG